MSFLPTALLVAIILAGPARAEHTGTFEGIAMSDSGGACKNGMVRVTMDETEAVIGNSANVAIFAITWSADAFTGQSSQGARINGQLDGDHVIYETSDASCTFHFDGKRIPRG